MRCENVADWGDVDHGRFRIGEDLGEPLRPHRVHAARGERPANERPFLLLVVGYPAADARVPQITKKSLNEFVTFV